MIARVTLSDLNILKFNYGIIGSLHFAKSSRPRIWNITGTRNEARIIPLKNMR